MIGFGVVSRQFFFRAVFCDIKRVHERDGLNLEQAQCAQIQLTRRELPWPRWLQNRVEQETRG